MGEMTKENRGSSDGALRISDFGLIGPSDDSVNAADGDSNNPCALKK